MLAVNKDRSLGYKLSSSNRYHLPIRGAGIPARTFCPRPRRPRSCWQSLAVCSRHSDHVYEHQRGEPCKQIDSSRSISR